MQWLANNFEYNPNAQDDMDRMMNAIHVYATAGAAKIEELAKYEQLQKDGLLYELPCKLGSSIYIVGSKYRGGHNEYWINTGHFKLSDCEKLNDTVFLSWKAADEHRDFLITHDSRGIKV